MSTLAIGVDIGGTGIKGALVDVETGELVSAREKIATPQGGRPDDILAATVELVSRFDASADGVPPAAPVGGGIGTSTTAPCSLTTCACGSAAPPPPPTTPGSEGASASSLRNMRAAASTLSEHVA